MTLSPGPWHDFVSSVQPRTRTGGKRAPHQPALLLAWLEHFHAHASFDLPFVVARERMSRALPMLSNSASVAGKTSQPFAAFARSPYWEMISDGDIDTYAKGTLKDHSLVAQRAALRPAPGMVEQWRGAGATAAPELISAVLNTFFPPRAWQHVLDQFPDLRSVQGVSPFAVQSAMGEDEHEIRAALIRSSEGCSACAIRPSGLLEVVHPMWLSHGGSLTVDNAVLMCRTHAAALDIGWLGVVPTTAGWSWTGRLADTAHTGAPAGVTTWAWHADNVLLAHDS